LKVNVAVVSITEIKQKTIELPLPLVPGTWMYLFLLQESDILCIFSKALTADVQSVFSDQTSLMSTDSALS
jgi:hypothetical protein